MTYPDILAQFDAHTADDGRHWEVRTRWLPRLAPGAAAAIAAAVFRKTSPHSAVIVHHFRGAAARVPPGDTAFGLRREHFMVEIIAAWGPGRGDGSAHRRWARNLWRDLSPFALPGGNAARLRAAKRRFDPDGVFASAIPLPGG